MLQGDVPEQCSSDVPVLLLHAEGLEEAAGYDEPIGHSIVRNPGTSLV